MTSICFGCQTQTGVSHHQTVNINTHNNIIDKEHIKKIPALLACFFEIRQ